MAENESVQEYIRQYIRANRNIYTSSVIIQNLLKAGYSRMDIDTAYTSIESDNKPKQAARPKITQRDIGFLIMVVGFPLLGVIAFFLITRPTGNEIYLLSQTSIFLNFALIFLAWISSEIVVRRANPELADGIRAGFKILLVCAIIFPCVVFGNCVFQPLR